MKDLSRKCLYNKKKSKVAQGVLVSLSGGSTGIPHFIYFMDVAIFTNVRQDLQPAKRLLLTLLHYSLYCGLESSPQHLPGMSV